jgi:hypothetical protein
MWLLATLTDQLVTLLAGFALTTAVGGALGSWFQRRTWDHQNERTLAEADRGHATEICRELSQLMDKRLYRMWQLNWALFGDPIEGSRVEARMQDYRAALYEWNDTLNRNLAAAEIQFGHALRDQLERDVYEGFRILGTKLEYRYRHIQSSQPSEADADLEERLSRDLRELRERIYAMVVIMLQQIREGRIGRHAPH